MKPINSSNDNNRSDELGGTLLAAVEATAKSHVDEATVRRVIDHASRLALIPTVFNTGFEPASRPNHQDSTSGQHFVRMISWSGIAAAVVSLVVGLLLISGDRHAFAQVQEQLTKVRTISFVFRSTDTATDKPGRVFIVEPDQIRQELADGRVFVTDLRNKQAMELDTQAKTAEIYPLYDIADRERRAAEMISRMRDAPGESVETIGRRQPDGRDVIDYRIAVRDGRSMKVTVDKTTKLPVYIEYLSADKQNVEAVATEFVFDEPIDEALVRIAAPDGYQVTQIKAAAGSDDESLVVSSKGLGPVTWGMKKDEIVKLIGQPDGVKPYVVPILQFADGKEKPIGKKTGEELIYDSRGYRLIVDSTSGVETIDCHGASLGDRARGFTGQTDKGIRMGSSRDEVSKAYGAPDIRSDPPADPSKGRWTYFELGLRINFFDNVVSHIQVVGPQMRRNTQGVFLRQVNE